MSSNTLPEPVTDLSEKIFHIFAGLGSSGSSVFVAPKYAPRESFAQGLTVMGEGSLNNKISRKMVLCCRIDPTKFMPWWYLGAVFSEVNETFLSLGDAPDKGPMNALIVIEIYVVLIYDRTHKFCRVYSSTQHLFSWKSCCLESILPLQSALVQHILGAAHQGGHIWGPATQRDPKLPSLAKWGWSKNISIWKTFLYKSGMNYELIHCKCRKTCKC